MPEIENTEENTPVYARVGVDRNTWKKFRSQLVARGRSVKEFFGEAVQEELEQNK